MMSFFILISFLALLVFSEPFAISYSLEVLACSLLIIIFLSLDLLEAVYTLFIGFHAFPLEYEISFGSDYSWVEMNYSSF